MIPELGLFALILALALALVQATIPLIGAARDDRAWMAVAAPAAIGQAVAVALALASLTYAYVVSDFTVSNVVENSHSAKPLLYKITGVWGNHEGSMVLWVFMLALFGALVAAFGRNLPPRLKARVLSVQAMIGIGFLLFILVTSNPFLRVDPPPLDGADLNPLLQDPGLAFHPPLLYFGYVGFSIAFSFAVAALIEGRVDAAWARWVRPWTLAAWCGLTAGIALGSWWAYYELGWGGWWFWDPVENASFMPWLTGTALLHSAIVVEKRDTLKSWTILLAIVTFALSLLGTFLVRSGVLTSVHAFAVDPARGSFILALLIITVGGALTLFAVRAPALKGGGLFAPISREGGLIINNLLLSTAAATVFVGTLYPLMLEAVGGGLVSVGPPFFNAVFVPLMIPLVVLMAIGPLLAWKRADIPGALGRLKVAMTLTVLTVLLFAWVFSGGPVLALIGVALGAWAILGALSELAERIKLFRIAPAASWRRLVGLPASAIGLTLAHAGLGIAVLGMVGTEAYKQEAVARVGPGETMVVGEASLTFEGVRQVEGPNYIADQGRLVAQWGGQTIVLTPERRWYPVAQRMTTEAAIHTTWMADLYVALGEPRDDGSWSVRAWTHPLVPWIWIGCGVMVLGGLVSLSDRRLRVGAPVRRAKVPAGTAGAPPTPAE